MHKYYIMIFQNYYKNLRIICIFLVKLNMVIKLKNKLWIFLILLIIIVSGIGFYFYRKNHTPNQSDYSASRTSTTNNSSTDNNSLDNNIDFNNDIDNNINDIAIADSSDKNDPITATPPAEPAPKKEELFSSFSTKIYSKDSARQNNVSITCNTLNDTIVANGSTFSFCNTVGPATSAKGYQKADIFDKDGNKKKGLGGGNCQVSTTLYNAVLSASNLVVTERHAHSNKVPYIQSGKDAAVAYGSYDLKFRNDSGVDIKIKASATASSVDIQIFKLL